MSDTAVLLMALFIYFFIAGIVYFVLRVTIYKHEDDTDDALMIAVGWPVSLLLCVLYVPFWVIEKAASKTNEVMDQIKKRDNVNDILK